MKNAFSRFHQQFVLLPGLWLVSLVMSVHPTLVHAQMLSDPSFELTTASSSTPNAGSGWTIVTNPNQQTYVYNNSFGYGTTSFGSQFLFLDGGSQLVSQTVNGPFTSGQVYRLIVSAADVEGGTAPSFTLSVSGGATASQMFNLTKRQPAGKNAGPLPLAAYELDFFPASSSPITISIFNGGGYPTAIDNVILTVPEPSTWLLLTLAMLFLGQKIRKGTALRRNR